MREAFRMRGERGLEDASATCERLVGEHILVGHAVPIALVAILGAIVAPRFVRP